VTYAIIKVAGKQYRVREGERLLVDRLREADGATFAPTVLLLGGDGTPAIAPADVKVTARVLGAVKGPKVRIGKYKKRTGYRRHTGFRASLTQIEIQSIGGAKHAARPSTARVKAPVKAEAPVKTEAPPAPKAEHVKGLPSGYEEMTVAEIRQASADWNAPMLAAALEYEQANAKRKGAITALESVIAAKEKN
jgi:large subunit ribosomal protein L21